MRIELGDGGRRLQLVAPQCFGELSALTGDPVSATVVAHRDVRAWVLSAPVLFEAMAQETAFFRNVATLLGMRLRERTRRAPTSRPRVVLMPLARRRSTGSCWPRVGRGLHHYAPGSEHDTVAGDDIAGGAGRMRRWREEGHGDAVLLLGVAMAGCAALLPDLDADDMLLVADDDLPGLPHALAQPIVWRRGPLSATAALQRWSHAPAARGDRGRRLGQRLVARAPAGARPPRAAALRPGRRRRHERRRRRRPGAPRRARGDRGRRPADRLSLRLEHGRGRGAGLRAIRQRARGGARRSCSLVAEFARSKGIQWLPRASLISASRMTSLTEQLFGDATFAAAAPADRRGRGRPGDGQARRARQRPGGAGRAGDGGDPRRVRAGAAGRRPARRRRRRLAPAGGPAGRARLRLQARGAWSGRRIRRRRPMPRAPPIASSSACSARSACAPRWAAPTACRAGGTRPAMRAAPTCR